MSASEPSPLRPLRLSDLAVLAGASLVWTVAALIVPLFPDEMYYWEWSRHLAPGYFDHPPAIAWLIRLGTLVFGDSALGVRGPAIACGIVAALGIRATALELGGAAAARRAMPLVGTIPLLAGAFILATPDAPLLATVSWALYAVLRASRQGAGVQASTRWWCLAGFLVGLGFLSKYTLVLVPAGVALAAALHRPLRRLFATPGPWLAVLVAAVTIVPLLAWNASHDWLSFRFQLSHGLGAPRGGSPLDRELSFLGGQVGLATPILFVMLAWAAGKTFRDAKDSRAVLLAGVVSLVFAVFAWSASRKPVEANWPALAYPAAIALLAVAPLERRGQHWLTAGMVLGGLLTVTALILVATPLVTFEREPEATAQAYGWDAVAAEVADVALKDSLAVALKDSLTVAGGSRLFLAANRYQDAAALAFYLPSHPEVFALNLGSRPNQYDLWPGFAETAGQGDGLLVLLDDREADETGVVKKLEPYFDAVERGAAVERRRGANVLGRKRVWLFSGWRGGWPPPAEPGVRR
jgi:4-amino-4-deoxy-L-arabinose transferase-like glycosyltransferase